MTCSSRRPIPFASNTGLRIALLAVALIAPASAAQQVDEALVTELARVLAAADARRWDAALLRDALQHADPGVRRQAALAAGRIGDAGAVDLLLPALGDSTPAVRAAAAFALGLLKDPRAIEPLMGLVRGVARDSQGVPQIEAVTAIAKIGGDAGARALHEVLQAGVAASAGGGGGAQGASAAVGAALIEAWRLGARAPIPELLGFVDDADPSTRGRALYSLGRLRPRVAATALLAGLRDRDAGVRAIALRGTTRALVDSARLDPRAIAQLLLPLLDEREGEVRINALRALATFRDSTTASRVVPLVADPDVGVAVQAETTLGALGGSLAIATLRGFVTAGPFALRRQAVIGLAQADSAAGAVAATALARDADWHWRSVAAEAFAACRARGALEGLLADPDGRVVGQAVQGLTRIVPATDTALLTRARQLLTHADPVVRSGAADLLARAPSADDVEALVQAYQRAAGDPFDDAALSAVHALAEIAKASNAGRLRVVTRFIAVVTRPTDYLVHRLAADQLPDARDEWGPPGAIVTGRTEAEYRDAARRWLAPALLGRPNPQITLETDRGSLVIELLPAEAPLTVAAFLALVERRFFDGSSWHRVVPNFVVQDGDPRGDGSGGPGFVLRDEVNPTRYLAGTMGMALSGPDTGGSQFFITHSPQPHLDGTYTVFGRVVSGGAVLNAIAMGDRIRSIHR